MAIANLHETLMSYKLRRNALNLEITQLQNQKSLATYSQADAQSLKNAQDRANRAYFKSVYEADQADGGAHKYDDYKDYTEIPDFEDEVDKKLLKASIEKLNSREKNIMELRYGFIGGSEKTQKEVADMLGISQSYISRLEKKIIGKMKKDIISKTG